MDSFKCGDVVVLKAGSDPMGVESQDGNSVNCVWTVKGIVQRDCFASELLELYEPGEGGVMLGW